MTAAEKHIRYYNSLNGKPVNKAQLSAFHAALKKDIATRRIDAHMPLGIECIDVEKRIGAAIPKMNGHKVRVNLKEVDVDKILRTYQKQKAESGKQKAVVVPDKKLLGDVVPAAKKVKTLPMVAHQASESNTGTSNSKFFTLHLKPPYNDFVKIHSDSQIMYYGLPGSGKTWDEREFARYLAKEYKLNVLYTSPEEYGRGTWDEKNKEQNFKLDVKDNYSTAVDGRLVFNKSLNALPPGKRMEDFQAVFFDSVDKMKWKLADFEAFCAKYPNMIKVITKQTTKEGDFKGGQEWAHEVDIEVEVNNRKRIFHKNRNDSDFARKRDKLLFDNKVKTKQERELVRQQVNERMRPSTEPPLATFRPDTIA